MAATAGIGAGDQSQMVRPPKPAHPKGKLLEMKKDPLSVTLEVDSFDVKIHVEWEPEASVTSMWQLAFFIQFFKNGSSI
ncbi:hypothetical protein [Endozoicomonas sp. YOMI1]|uniref:hypothetical protein n=1 Tax=Endozoicomonas sp. YOMI1 TaxID=2828739 RepID=UPI002147B327|nr:hypothetical protein [Endozoicomonas sp. YOMI1]